MQEALTAAGGIALSVVIGIAFCRAVIWLWLGSENDEGHNK